MTSQVQHPHALGGNMPWRWRDFLSAALFALVLIAMTACGGGGTDMAGVGTGGTGSYAVGPISGLGSIVVNGVHYDETQATVLDDDGSASDSSALQVGMVVEIRGSIDADGKTGSATTIDYAAEVRGPVTAVDASAGTLKVFDRLVKVTPATVYADVAGLAALAAGNVVSVYGLPDADGSLAATRIEFEAASVGAFDGEFRVRGTLSGLTGTAPNRRFTVAGVTVTTDAATRVDGTLAEGVQVGVRLAKTVAGDGSYGATRVRTLNRSFTDDMQRAELEGLVSGFTSADAPFSVGGLPARLGAAVLYIGGTAADLADGVRVEVEGDVVGGTLIVSKLEFKHEDADGGEDGSDAPFEFKGTASCSPAPCGDPAGAIVIRGTTVHYDAATRFDNGVGPSNLDGAVVEVKAVAVTGSGGTTFRATRIEPAH